MMNSPGNMSDNPKPLTLADLFSQDSNTYVIPEYQRNYAWGEKEILELMTDITGWYDRAQDKAYYIGTLIVHNRNGNNSEKSELETIDGQQRLTTLYILLCVLKDIIGEDDNIIPGIKQYRLNLKFDCRPKSNETLNELFKNAENINISDPAQAIMNAYRKIKNRIKLIENKQKDGFSLYCQYLLTKVKIFQVTVPEKTDLNHYFEIMNSRGEQLEMHEILKSRCMEKLEDDRDRQVFNTLWEACSNMEKYVQSGFFTDGRSAIFGNDLNSPDFSSFDNLSKNFLENILYDKMPLEDIINTSRYLKIKTSDNAGFTSERFHSVINFSNFLLQVLRVWKKEDIILDDKRLLEQFGKYISEPDFVKDFCCKLIKARFLADKYIIKRDYSENKESWSLKSIKTYDKSIGYVNTFGIEDEDESENENLIMLLSMFHVSIPSQNYKHWYSAVLKYLLENEKQIDQKNYRQFLENLAKSYLFDYFLSQEGCRSDYYTMIFKNNCIPKNMISDIDLGLLNRGTRVENFIFNYTDYLLWKKEPCKFEFTFRSSVEHFYPQYPVGGNKKLEEKDEHGVNYLDNFGNLCLISSNTNSRFNNDMPVAKINNYYDSENKNPQSLKLMLIMDMAKSKEPWSWGVDEIKEHYEAMKKLLLEN